MPMEKKYSLRKCRKILHQGQSAYIKKRARLSSSQAETLFQEVKKLQQAISEKEREVANHSAHRVETLLKTYLPKTFIDQTKEFCFALLFAIVVAFVVREYWFELYEVPTGSMRPTILEQDRLLVSKSSFGLHIPFQNRLALFKPSYVLRNGIIVFTVEGMDVPDAETVYFYLFPGIKRYVKRCAGKPGDRLYFYGGRIYGIDKEKNSISELADETLLKKLGLEGVEHIPCITFEGKVGLHSPLHSNLYSQANFRQMNREVGKLELTGDGDIVGHFFNGKEWLKDDPAALKEKHETPKSYADLFGIGNYANARLLTKEQVISFYSSKELQDNAPLYLELRHTPNLTYPLPEMRRDEGGRLRPTITPMIALLPLKESHLKTLQKALFTSRFIIKNEHAYRYHEGGNSYQRAIFDPFFPNVPNGTYEFYDGVGYKVGWGGIRSTLAPNHPLYLATPGNIQKLFNLGINFNLLFQPQSAWQPFIPERFAYFRNGALYLMGKPLLEKDDPLLQDFINKEREREKQSTEQAPYVAFIDRGAPTSIEFIEAFGLKVPDDGVLALGDNYSMSADSRDFGFVPLHNLRGAPSFTFWPPSHRVGDFPQPHYPFLTLPNLLVWVGVLLVILFVIYSYKKRKKLFK